MPKSTSLAKWRAGLCATKVGGGVVDQAGGRWAVGVTVGKERRKNPSRPGAVRSRMVFQTGGKRIGVDPPSFSATYGPL